MRSRKHHKNRRIFYAAGPGKVIGAHKFWKSGVSDPGRFPLTYSGHVEDYCAKIGADLYMVSHNSDAEEVCDGKFRIQHAPKPLQNARGMFFHLREIIYGVKLIYKAIKFRADVFIVSSGTAHWFIFLLLRLWAIKVVPVLHCTLWPKNYYPSKGIERLILWANLFFFRYGAFGIIGVSPECCRQVEQLTGGKSAPLFQIRAQYMIGRFKKVAHLPPYKQSPFRILFVGRIIENKGVFDVLEMASVIEEKMPGRVQWDICGDGPDFDTLKQLWREKGLESVVTLHGWIEPEKQIQMYSVAHASIVPTRSNFAEGLAVVAAESVICGRPVITNPVVPAAELLGDAAVVAQTDNVDSYVKHILRLVEDENFYHQKVQACAAAGAPFLDREQGLDAVLERVLDQPA